MDKGHWEESYFCPENGWSSNGRAVARDGDIFEGEYWTHQ